MSRRSATPEVFDSADEWRLYELLREWLGSQARAVCVVPQVGLGALVGSRLAAATDQRVDFLIAHPGLPRSLVVEVDGLQHDSRGKTMPIETGLSKKRDLQFKGLRPPRSGRALAPAWRR